MNKFFKKILIFHFVFLGLPNIVNGQQCNYQDKANLNAIASKVSINYEIIEIESEIEFTNPDTGEEVVRTISRPSFKMSIYNIDEKIYIEQSNDLNSEIVYIEPSAAVKGVYTFESNDVDNIVRYKFDIRSNLEGCYGDILKTFNFVKPKSNMYSQYEICRGHENLPYCQQYITEEIKYNESEIRERILKGVDKPKEKEDVKNGGDFAIDFLKENYLYIIISAVIVGGAIAGYIIVKRRRVL